MVNPPAVSTRLRRLTYHNAQQPTTGNLYDDAFLGDNQPDAAIIFDNTEAIGAAPLDFIGWTKRVVDGVERWGVASTPPVPPPVIVSNPVVTQMNTTNTNTLNSDGISWAQSHSFVVDKYNKFITVVCVTTSNSVYFEYSNDSGATWHDDLQQSFILRGSIGYDSVNDILHVLWACSAPTDGVLYRRYTISRDGSHNITGISRDMNVNLQLDFQTAGVVEYKQPVLLWCNDAGFGAYGALLAVWSIEQEGAASNGAEVRASMRVLSNTVDDNVVGNWKFPVADSASTISTDAQVAYTLIDSTTQLNIRLGVTACRKAGGGHALDVYVAYSIYPLNSWIYKFRRLRWNSGALDWSTGLTNAVNLSNMTRAGSDAGYAQKSELLTEIVEDSTNDRLIVGLCTWKNNTDGDSWGYVAIAANDSVSAVVDVYSAGALNNGATIFISGDVACDNGYVVVSYTNLPGKATYVRAFNSSDVEVESPLLVYGAAPLDTPVLWKSGSNARYNNKLLVVFRDFNPEAANNPPTYSGGPYKGYIATLNWFVP